MWTDFRDFPTPTSTPLATRRNKKNSVHKSNSFSVSSSTSAKPFTTDIWCQDWELLEMWPPCVHWFLHWFKTFEAWINALLWYPLFKPIYTKMFGSIWLHYISMIHNISVMIAFTCSWHQSVTVTYSLKDKFCVSNYCSFIQKYE